MHVTFDLAEIEMMLGSNLRQSCQYTAILASPVQSSPVHTSSPESIET